MATAETVTIPQLVTRHAAAIGAAVGLAVIELLVLVDAPYPTRDLAVELKFLAIAFPLGLWAIMVHAARRAPKLADAAVMIFLITFAIRFPCLLFSAEYHLQHDPANIGFLDNDAYGFSMHARVIAQMLTGEAYGLNEKYNIDSVEPQFVMLGVAALLRNPSAELWHHSRLSTLLVAGLGFSVIAFRMLFCVLGCFMVAQVFLFFTLRVRPVVGAFVLVWISVDPMFITAGIGWNEDTATIVILVYLMELLLDQGNVPLLRQVMRYVALGLFGSIFRDWMPGFVMMFAIYQFVRQRYFGRVAWAVDLALFALVVIFFQSPAEAVWFNPNAPREDHNFLRGLIFSSLLLPGPQIANADGFFDSVRLMALFPLSLVWPFLVVLIGNGLLLFYLNRTRLPACAVYLTLIFIALANARYPGTVGVIRIRNDVMPMLLAIAAEGIIAARGMPVAYRKGLVKATIGYALLAFGMDALAGMS